MARWFISFPQEDDNFDDSPLRNPVFSAALYSAVNYCVSLEQQLHKTANLLVWLPSDDRNLYNLVGRGTKPVCGSSVWSRVTVRTFGCKNAGFVIHYRVIIEEVLQRSYTTEPCKSIWTLSFMARKTIYLRIENNWTAELNVQWSMLFGILQCRKCSHVLAGFSLQMEEIIKPWQVCHYHLNILVYGLTIVKTMLKTIDNIRQYSNI